MFRRIQEKSDKATRFLELSDYYLKYPGFLAPAKEQKEEKSELEKNIHWL